MDDYGRKNAIDQGAETQVNRNLPWRTPSSPPHVADDEIVIAEAQYNKSGGQPNKGGKSSHPCEQIGNQTVQVVATEVRDEILEVATTTMEAATCKNGVETHADEEHEAIEEGNREDSTSKMVWSPIKRQARNKPWRID